MQPASSRVQSVLVGIALVLAASAFGFLAGGFFATRFLPLDDMGFDQIANAVGGGGVGVVVGFAAGLILAFILRPRPRVTALGVAALGVAVLVALLFLVPPAR